MMIFKKLLNIFSIKAIPQPSPPIKKDVKIPIVEYRIPQQDVRQFVNKQPNSTNN